MVTIYIFKYICQSLSCFIYLHIYPTQSITKLSPSPWVRHLIDFARRLTFFFSCAKFFIAFYAARALCSQMDFIMCRELSRYFIVPGKGQFREIERARGGSGRRSFREGQVISMLGSFSLLSLFFFALSQPPSNTFAFNYQARGQN